jgi:hypothetical protein
MTDQSAIYLKTIADFLNLFMTIVTSVLTVIQRFTSLELHIRSCAQIRALQYMMPQPNKLAENKIEHVEQKIIIAAYIQSSQLTIRK